MQIVTFDFHNTVARCDPWFELEIRHLPAAVLETLHGRDPSAADRARSLYRALRADVISSGVERDATTCTLDVFASMGIAAERGAVLACIDDLMRACLPDLSPVPGAVETIDALIDAGVPVGIVSSAVHHGFLEWSLERFGLLDRLAFVATSASVGYYKSVPDIYHHAYALVAANPSLGVHIGDSPRWDIATSRIAGIAGVLYRPEPHDGSEDHAPDLVLTSLIDAHAPITELLARRRLAS